MIFCNIHIHTIPEDEKGDQLVIVNRIIREEIFTGEDLSTFCSVGIHPWYITNEKEQWKLFLQEADQKNVIAIGECGLDKFSTVDLSKQKELFVNQAILANDRMLPLIIHCVKAWNELLHIHKELNPKNIWIVHGFRGNGIQAGQLMKAGLKLSFGFYFNPEALSVAWPNALFTETDDEDVKIETVYDRIATTLNISIPELAEQVYKNVTQTFSL